MRAKHNWAMLVAEQARSGLTQRAFCAQHGMHPVSFSQARRKLLAHRSSVREWRPAAPRFVRVVPQAPVQIPRLELTFGALTLGFAAATPPAVVAALVDALT
ncbi:MAG: IS66 family insertion sequence element accessory protein TnpA [Gemmatimonadaceae bacterium]